MSNDQNLKKSGKEISFPLIYCIHQDIKTPRITDIASELRSKLDDFGLKKFLKPNDTVAITAGSRGISNQSTILKSIINYLKELKTFPFIIPAMGSHGGGTVEGQLQILNDYGITE